jgi:pullulanase
LSSTHRNNISLIISHFTENPYEAVDDTNLICAAGCLFDPFLQGSFQYVRSQDIDTQIIRILNSSLNFASGKSPVIYIENNNHSTFVNQAGGRDRWYKTQPYAIALLTSPGAVMIHNGQEFGDNNYMPESSSARVQARPLHWGFSSDSTGKKLLNLYKKLIQIRKKHPSLGSANFSPWPYNKNQIHFNSEGYGIDVDKNVVIYQRWGDGLNGQKEKFIIVINFSDSEQDVDIPFPDNGTWEDLLNEASVIIENNQLSNQKIKANWGRIYFGKN